MTRYNCTKEGMGGGFKCIFFGSIYHDAGTCTSPVDCDHKKIDPRDKMQSMGEKEVQS